MSSRAALRLSGPGARGRALTRPDGNRVSVGESCNTGAFLQPRHACGTVMTPESPSHGVTFGGRSEDRMGLFARERGRATVDSRRGLAPMLDDVKLNAESGQQVRASTEPPKERNDSLPRRRHQKSLDRPTRDEHQHRRPGPYRPASRPRRNTGTTCLPVPTIRPSTDDPPRFGASAGARSTTRLYCRTNGCASILELHPEGGIATLPGLRLSPSRID